MRGTALALALIASGCVRTSSVTCDDGTVCREGTTCFAVTDGFVCVAPDEIVCGNHRVEGDEVCDDGNIKPGDGCSTDCRSDESCGNETVDPVIEVDGRLLSNEQCDDGGVVGHDGCSSSCMSEIPRWVPVRAVPAIRAHATIASEATAHRAVLFGGRTLEGTIYYNDTWMLAANGWTQLQTLLSPSPRAVHAMGSDGTRSLLFGGTDGTNTLGDTWILDGNRWTSLSFESGATPKPRVGASIAFMPNVGYVLFGGFVQGPTDETWVFANGVWTDISDTAGRPTARQFHTLTYDPVRERLVLAAGIGVQYMDDTWEFDGTRWTEIPNSMGPRRQFSSAAFDRTRGRVVLHGGVGVDAMLGPPSGPVVEALMSSSKSDTYEWDGAVWTHIPTADPVRDGSVAFTDPDTGRATMFGGEETPPTCPLIDCGATFNTLFTWSGTVWTSIAYEKFPIRSAIAATLDIDRQRVVVFGGLDPTYRDETYETAGGSWMQVGKGTKPNRRFDAALAYGRFGMERSSILFGGYGPEAVPDPTLADTWSWDGLAWTALSPPTSPLSRRGHAMAYDAARQRIVMFGGSRGAQSVFLDDTWEFDGTTWMRIPQVSAGPLARDQHAMAYDPIRKRVLMFGGRGVDMAIYGDLWSWDGTAWTALTAPLSPPTRAGAGMAWDGARRRMVLFGGSSDDTWEWNGTSWEIAPMFERPTARTDHAIVSAPGGAGVLSIGGNAATFPSTSFVPDVLHYMFESGSTYATCLSDYDDDHDGASGCDDLDCWAVCTPWCPPGDPSCDTTAPSCGDTSCEAERESCGICGDCACP